MLLIGSRNVVLDEGGSPPPHTPYHMSYRQHPRPRHGAPVAPDSNASAYAPSLTPSPTPAPSISTSHPRSSAHTPVHNDDPRYMVSPYGSRQTNGATSNIARATDSEDPRSYEATACLGTAKRLAAQKPMDVLDMASRPKDHKDIRSG